MPEQARTVTLHIAGTTITLSIDPATGQVVRQLSSSPTAPVERPAVEDGRTSAMPPDLRIAE